MNEQLSTLINMVIDLSPEVWRILLRQVYVNATINLLWIIGLTVFVHVGNRVVVSYKHSSSPAYWEVMNPARMTISFIILLTNFILFTTAVAQLINPEYYAIKLILLGTQ